MTEQETILAIEYCFIDPLNIIEEEDFVRAVELTGASRIKYYDRAGSELEAYVTLITEWSTSDPYKPRKYLEVMI